MNNALQSQIDELETKIAFQDATIEELNQEVIKLNDLVARQQYQMQLIVDKLLAMEPSNIATQAEETPLLTINPKVKNHYIGRIEDRSNA